MRSHRLAPTAVSLARLLAGWLVVIVVVQGLAAALALVHGPSHRHAGTGHAHEDAQRHHHDSAGDELAAVPDGADAQSDGSVLSALALGLPSRAASPAVEAPARVWGAGVGWTPSSCCVVPPRHPPRG
jgi:hypothetical protein